MYTSSTPVKALAEAKKIGNLWERLVESRMANHLMDRELVGVVFFGVAALVAVATSPQLLDVVRCSALVVVV